MCYAIYGTRTALSFLECSFASTRQHQVKTTNGLTEKCNMKSPVLLLAASTYQIPQHLPSLCHSRRSVSLGLSAAEAEVSRPLLKEFGESLIQKVRQLRTEDDLRPKGRSKSHLEEACLSDEYIPRLTMRHKNAVNNDRQSVASPCAIREAFSAASNRSTSGSVLLHLTGADAASIRGLTGYANRFFDEIDQPNNSHLQDSLNAIRVTDYVYAGYDDNVNDEGKMQLFDTRILSEKTDDDRNSKSDLLPFEIEDLVGSTIHDDAKDGIDTLFGIGVQVVRAVLGMDETSAKELIDTGGHAGESTSYGGISNSYHRIIRYPRQTSKAKADAFPAHVDSSFLTLIPLTDIPGLEIWCPESGEESVPNNGEWVRPSIPTTEETQTNRDTEHDNDVFVVAMAGEFLELLSDGHVPVCIHRVVGQDPAPDAPDADQKARISAPLFLRPRRGDRGRLDLTRDLGKSNNNEIPFGTKLGMYHRQGLLDECDGMQLWSAHHFIHG